MKSAVLMLLFGWLFGCSRPGKKVSSLPFLEELPGVRKIAVPEGFVARNFIFSPDGRAVFLLCFGMAGTPDHMPYRVLRIDLQGEASPAFVELPDQQWIEKASLWWEEDGRLGMHMADTLVWIDPQTMKVAEQARIISQYNFLPQRKLDQLIPAEAQEAYAAAVAKLKGKNPRRVREFLLTGKAAWMDPDAEAAPEPAETAIECTKSQVVDTKLRYPRYVDITLKEWRILPGGPRFQTTDAGDRELGFFLADDGRLRTSDGAAWIRYEKKLYRLPAAK